LYRIKENILYAAIDDRTFAGYTDIVTQESFGSDLFEGPFLKSAPAYEYNTLYIAVHEYTASYYWASNAAYHSGRYILQHSSRSSTMSYASHRIPIPLYVPQHRYMYISHIIYIPDARVPTRGSSPVATRWLMKAVTRWFFALWRLHWMAIPRNIYNTRISLPVNCIETIVCTATTIIYNICVYRRGVPI